MTASDPLNYTAEVKLPERIICMTEETTEWLYLLGEEWRIVGISGFTVRPPRARKEKPKVSAFTSAKTHKILELEPDLVIGFSDMQAEIAAEDCRAAVQAQPSYTKAHYRLAMALLAAGHAPEAEWAAAAGLKTCSSASPSARRSAASGPWSSS